MSFLHTYLLGGLVLAGLPILVHLIMRQKPKTLPFPAFRFLKQRHLINRRKLRLQHLLLMLLRILLIAALCLALAQPKVSLRGLGYSSDQPVAAVLVFDTSASMEYSISKQSRLEVAKERARELLGEMAEGSSVAVFETAEDASDDSLRELRDLGYARSRIDALRVRPSSAALHDQIARAYRLLEKEADRPDARPCFVYILSDRTQACWDGARASSLKKPDNVRVLFLDVGVDEPRDLSIDSVEVEPAVAAPGARIQVRVTVRATGGDFENEVHCNIESDPEANQAGERQKPIKVASGETQTVTFVRQAPKRDATEYVCQLSVRLATGDALPFNNVRHATFLVRRPRQVLTIVTDRELVDDREPVEAWRNALASVATERPADAFRTNVVTLAEAEALTPEKWREYKIVCLFQTAKPPAALWEKIAEFVKQGGGLVLVPGGNEMLPGRNDYNDEAEKVGLLPARWSRIVTVPSDKEGVPWLEFSPRHPLTAPFRKWSQADTKDLERAEIKPRANAYWEVEPTKEGIAIAEYADDKHRPSMVERAVGKGRVLQFTTVLDGREVEKNRAWNNYFSETWFGFVLVNETCRYLAGDTSKPNLNFTCGQSVAVVLPQPAPRDGTKYRLLGPELTESETTVTATAGQTTLDLKQAVVPGNYTLWDENSRLLTGISLNVFPDEGRLERVDIKEIEKVLGEDSVVPLGHAASLRDALKGVWSPPVELLPWLMMFILLALTIEGLLSSKFYARPPADDTPEGRP